MNKKKNLLVDGGCDCRASDISFASDAKRVLRGRGRAMESVRACAVSWVRSFNSFIFYENLKVCQVSVLKCFEVKNFALWDKILYSLIFCPCTSDF